jgi:hypothetical protein
MWVNSGLLGHGTVSPVLGGRCPMRRFALKAVFTALTVNRAESRRPDWDRIVLLAATIGLIVLYAYGKATSRW